MQGRVVGDEATLHGTVERRPQCGVDPAHPRGRQRPRRASAASLFSRLELQVRLTVRTPAEQSHGRSAGPVLPNVDGPADRARAEPKLARSSNSDFHRAASSSANGATASLMRPSTAALAAVMSSCFLHSSVSCCGSRPVRVPRPRAAERSRRRCGPARDFGLAAGRDHDVAAASTPGASSVVLLTASRSAFSAASSAVFGGTTTSSKGA